MTFFLTRQFQCEYSGKTNLDYFSALASEKQESRIVRERFPDVLKGRVLATVQFRESQKALHRCAGGRAENQVLIAFFLLLRRRDGPTRFARRSRV